MTKVVYNGCFGGFSVSRAALHRLRELGNKCALEETDLGEKWPDSDEVKNLDYNSYCREIERTDPNLLRVVEEMGPAASGEYAELQIADIPTGTRYRIDEYDGLESVMTVDDYEWNVA